MASKLLANGKRVLVGSKADPDSKNYKPKNGVVQPPVTPAPLQSNTPAVITSKNARREYNDAKVGIDNLSNQLSVSQQPTITQSGSGYQVSGQGQFYGSQQEAIAASRSFTQPPTGQPATPPPAGPKVTPEQQASRTSAIQNLIEQGVTDPGEISRKLNFNDKGKATGDITPAEIDSVLSQNPELVQAGNTNRELNKIVQEQDKLTQGYLQQVAQLQNGTFKLSPEESSYISALQANFTRQAEQQKVANQNFEGAITNAGIAAGRNRYAPEIEAGNIQVAISDGLQRVADIENKALTAVFEAKQAIGDKKYKYAVDMYNEAKSALSEKSRAIKEMHDNVVGAQKEAAERQDKAFKRSVEFGKALSATVYGQLGSDEAENARIIQDYASQYGIDPNLLLSAISEREVEAAKEERANWSPIYKEWQNYKNEEIIAGREPVDFNAYQTMDVNRKAKVARAGASVTVNADTGLSKAQQAFLDDASTFVAQLGQGKVKWGSAWNAMRTKYPVATNEEIDQALRKADYYKVN